MRSVLQSVVCERVRSQISLEIDGELSELERRMVAAHVERCPDCRAFRGDVRAFTSELRAEPLEELDHPIVVILPRRASFGRVTLGRVQVGVAAAVAVVALGLAAELAGSKADQSPLLTTPTRYATASQLAREVRQIAVDSREFGREQGSKIPM